MKIDIFQHILPPKYKEALKSKARFEINMRTAEVCPIVTDLDLRFKAMDKYPDYVQVLSIVLPPVNNVTGPKDTVELSKIANDEMAEIVFKYPDRFITAAACLPLNDIDASVKELDRAIQDLRFRCIQIFTSINGKPLDSPEFFPLYERMLYYDLPILMHPVRENNVPDYSGEEKSKYNIFSTFGWPFETSAAMARLVFSGVLAKYPNLKIVTHHSGGMVPFYAQRINMWQGISEMRLGNKYEFNMTKEPLDYFRIFYNDTATYGSTPALMCSYSFFGADHLLFGTDMPYDNQGGHRVLRESIRSVEEMNIPDSEKKKIFEDNARKLMRLPI